MMGHRPRRDRGAYDIFDSEYVRREYAKAEPSLSLMADYPGPAGQASNMLQERVRVGATEKIGPQRIVRERKLESHFQRGWRYVTTLPSRNIVIEQIQR